MASKILFLYSYRKIDLSHSDIRNTLKNIIENPNFTAVNISGLNEQDILAETKGYKRVILNGHGSGELTFAAGETDIRMQDYKGFLPELDKYDTGVQPYEEFSHEFGIQAQGGFPLKFDARDYEGFLPGLATSGVEEVLFLSCHFGQFSDINWPESISIPKTFSIKTEYSLSFGTYAGIMKILITNPNQKWDFILHIEDETGAGYFKWKMANEVKKRKQPNVTTYSTDISEGFFIDLPSSRSNLFYLEPSSEFKTENYIM